MDDSDDDVASLGCIVVDKYMRSSLDGIYAAGDCCTCFNMIEDIQELLVAIETTNRSKVSDICDEFVTQPHTIRSVVSKVVDQNAQKHVHWFQMKLWTQVQYSMP